MYADAKENAIVQHGRKTTSYGEPVGVDGGDRFVGCTRQRRGPQGFHKQSDFRGNDNYNDDTGYDTGQRRQRAGLAPLAYVQSAAGFQPARGLGVLLPVRRSVLQRPRAQIRPQQNPV